MKASRTWVSPGLVSKLFLASLLCVATFALYRVLQLFQLRFGYGGDLEWMEGGMLEHARRLRAGLPIYVAPQLDFTPYIYTPFFYQLAALLGKWLPLTVQLLRGISIAGFVLGLLASTEFLRRQTGKLWPGLLCAGLYAACFRLGGAWFDVGRSDSLMVGLLFSGAFLWMESEKLSAKLAAVLLLNLAVWTKQTALAPVLAIQLAAVPRLKRNEQLASVLGLASLGLLALLTDYQTHGWFRFYTLELGRHHHLIEGMKKAFFKHDLLGVLLLPAVLSLYELGKRLESRRDLPQHLPHFAFVAGVLAQTWSSRVHTGMYDNVLMQMHLLLACYGSLGFARLYQTHQKSFAGSTAAAVGLLAMLWHLDYDFEAQVPQVAHRQQFAQMVSRLRELPKSTWVPCYSTASVAAGQEAHAHWMALSDIGRAGELPARRELESSIERELASGKFEAIIWTPGLRGERWFERPLRRYYELAGSIESPALLTGWNAPRSMVWRFRTPPNRESVGPSAQP